jgi:hypothetical protein
LRLRPRRSCRRLEGRVMRAKIDPVDIAKFWLAGVSADDEAIDAMAKVVIAAQAYMAEFESPSPDMTLRRRNRDALAAALKGE